MGGITVHFIRKLRTPILNGLNTTSARSNGFSGFRNAGAGDSTNAITMGHNLANGSQFWVSPLLSEFSSSTSKHHRNGQLHFSIDSLLFKVALLNKQIFHANRIMRYHVNVY